MNVKAFLLLAVIGLACGCINQPPNNNPASTAPTEATTVATQPITECVLSLCDCKCYPKGSTPEELTGKLCGINCLRYHGISGCGNAQGVCVPIVVSTTLPEQPSTVPTHATVVSTTSTTQPSTLANPASVKCIQDGGIINMTSNAAGERGICYFPDGSVCDEWEYFRGNCTIGSCMKKCFAIGTRSEGWYDCHNRLLYWDNCQNQTGAVGNNGLQICGAYQAGGATVACTMEYNPVCAKVQTGNTTEWKTFGNACTACTSGIATEQVAVLGYKQGECPTPTT